MTTKNEVKEFLKNAIPEARKRGVDKINLAKFLSKFGIAIKDIQMRQKDKFQPHLLVEYLDDKGEVKEAHFDLVEIDGRPAEEIEKELIKGNKV